MIYARKKDANHDAIREAVRRSGWSVIETYQHPGMLDMLAARDGITVWIECKMPGAKLTAAERRIVECWPGIVIVAYSPDDAVTQLRLCTERFAG